MESRCVADGARAVSIGAFQRESHPRPHILSGPVGLAVLANGCQGAGKRAIGIGLARPDMPLVEMGVHVREGWQHHATAHIDAGVGAVAERLSVQRTVRFETRGLILTSQRAGKGDIVERDRPVWQGKQQLGA